MMCPECGTQLTSRARFCHQCGWDSKLAAAGQASSSAGQRPAWKRWTMSVTLSMASLLVLWLLLIPRGTAADATLVVGQPAPDFVLESLSGQKVRLADLKGKPIILNFWASWCTPCRKEMPEFQQVYDRYKETGLQLFGINTGESTVAVSNFQQQVGTTFPILLDAENQAQTDYRILPLPSTFFIDRQGIVRAIYPYQMSLVQIEVEAERLQSQP